MKAPVMDFWVSTSIFLSGHGKEDPFGHGQLLQETVIERESRELQINPPPKPEARHDPRHLVFSR